MKDKQRLKQFAKTVFKFLLVGVLIAYLSRGEHLSLQKTHEALSQWQWIIPAFFINLVGVFLAIYRWLLLLRSQSIEMSYKRAVQLAFIGNFFNIALPGAVSGDFIKAIYIGRETPGKRAASFGSILFDRITGVSALIIVSATALLLSQGTTWGERLASALQTFIWTIAIGVVGFYFVLFLIKDHHDPLLKVLKKLSLRHALLNSIYRIYEGVRHYGSQKRAVAISLLVSCFIHALVATAFLFVSRSFNQPDLEVLSIFVIVPMGLLVTAIPVAPAGIGTGHAAFLWLFGLMSSKRGADIFSVFVLFQLIVGLLGALVYLKFKSSHASLARTSLANMPK